jgi:hypothetical protein
MFRTAEGYSITASGRSKQTPVTFKLTTIPGVGTKNFLVIEYPGGIKRRFEIAKDQWAKLVGASEIDAPPGVINVELECGDEDGRPHIVQIKKGYRDVLAKGNRVFCNTCQMGSHIKEVSADV